MNSICIIGAGASGIASLRELSFLEPVSRIILVDPLPPGRGTAFSQCSEWHLCNTSAETMSLNFSDSQEFNNWLPGISRTEGSNVFSSRGQYSSYVSSIYHEVLTHASQLNILVEYVKGTAVSVVDRGVDGVVIKTANGKTINSDSAVLSPGSGNAYIPDNLRHYRERYNFFESPYCADFNRFIECMPNARVLVIGTNLSAIDAVKTCLAYGSPSVMASPTGLLPSVRSALTLKSPLPLTHTKFMQMYRSPIEFRRNLINYVNSMGRELGHPIMDQISLSTNPHCMLREETLLAESDSNVWQYAIGELIDISNELLSKIPPRNMRILVDSCSPLIKRYVSAMPLVNAQSLIEAVDSGSLNINTMPNIIEPSTYGWRVFWNHEKPEYFDAIVCATGNNQRSWTFDRNSACVVNSSNGDRLNVDIDLRLAKYADNRQPRIWAIGGLTSSRFPITNYMRASVIQARKAAESISNMFRAREELRI